MKASDMMFVGKIMYTMDKEHPDWKYVDHTHGKRRYSYSDEYTFDVYSPISNPTGYWDADQIDAMKEHIKADLIGVAGDGTGLDHIHNVKISITKF